MVSAVAPGLTLAMNAISLSVSVRIPSLARTTTSPLQSGIGAFGVSIRDKESPVTADRSALRFGCEEASSLDIKPFLKDSSMTGAIE